MTVTCSGCPRVTKTSWQHIFRNSLTGFQRLSSLCPVQMSWRDWRGCIHIQIAINPISIICWCSFYRRRQVSSWMCHRTSRQKKNSCTHVGRMINIDMVFVCAHGREWPPYSVCRQEEGAVKGALFFALNNAFFEVNFWLRFLHGKVYQCIPRNQKIVDFSTFSEAKMKAVVCNLICRLNVSATGSTISQLDELSVNLQLPRPFRFLHQ